MYRKSSPTAKHNQNGFTFAELIVSVAVLLLVGGGGATAYSRYMRSSQEMDVRDVMSELRRDVETSLASPANLVRSLGDPENFEFNNCVGHVFENIQPDGQNTPTEESAVRKSNMLAQRCASTAADKFYPLVLRSLTGDVIAGGTNLANGDRTTTSARVLTARGETCSENSLATKDSRCEIEVTTAFRAICPRNSSGKPSASCATASTIELFFSIKQLSDGMFYKKGIRFPGFNNMVNSDGTPRDRFDALRVKALELVRPDSFQCPNGQTFKGFDKNGKVQCGYQNNLPQCKEQNWVFQRIDEQGKVICKKPLEGESCAATGDPLAVLKGVDSNGRLICQRPIASDFDPEFPDTSDTTRVPCKPGEVLVRFDTQGAPVCVTAAPGNECPTNKFLAGYEADGKARCVDMKTPSGIHHEVQGIKCGHQHGNCRYGSSDKPAGWKPTCPQGMFFVRHRYVGPHCCATCNWFNAGEWWCDYLVAVCSPYANAEWQ